MKYTEENLQYYGFRELVELVLFLQKKLNALKEQDYKRLKELEQDYIQYEDDKQDISLNYFDCKDFIIEILDSEFITIDLDKFKKVVKDYYTKCKNIEV